MDKNEGIAFLFNIAKEIKRSFESPVILITSKDYANDIYRSLLDIRSALMHDATPLQLAQIINNFHFEWLKAVKDINEFRKSIKETPREVILNAIDYTIKCMNSRYADFDNFIQQIKATMRKQDRLIMQADLEIMNDMKDSVTSILMDKKHCFKIQVDQYEYTIKLDFEVEELLNWLDRINDSLAIQFCKVIHLHIPQMPSLLTKTLHEIIDEAVNPAPEASKLLQQMESKGKLLSKMVRIDASHELEVSKVVEKIKVLEERINRLKDSKSSAVMALQHKVIYLEERLQSLENLKKSLNALQMEKSASRELQEGKVLDSAELHIFNHNLPHEERCKLVERLVKLWDNALHSDDTGKSIISILSAVDMKEVFNDDIGEFTVDKHGRKIYSRDGCDYQLNERNELVEVNDDEKHVYFYDDCGRYYIDIRRHRIYKAHANASEYELCGTGQLLKLKEVIDGVEYIFDSRGRYYIDEDGRRIYTDSQTGDKYELDGFGNLVRMHNKVCFFDSCPPEPVILKECKYLQKTVGNALKACLANVVLHQPEDPIAFLADSLVKYKQNIDDRQKRRDEEIKMKAEREFYETASDHLQSHITEEEDSNAYDYNLDSYQSIL